ncbi:MAG: hypothetical protein C0501_25450 [Isosphaera sp.]|nr:hypothetical protein [Isosphaera sp.]
MRRADADGTPRLALTGDGVIWLWVTVLMAAVGWYKSINLVLLLAYLMLALMVLNGVLARLHARRVSAAREPVPPAFAGEEVVVALSATNTAARAATAAVEDRSGGDPVTWFAHHLPPGNTARFAARRVFPVRGRSAPGLRVGSAYPFGLLRYDRGVPAEKVVVLPPAGVADADGLRRWLLRSAEGDGRARRVLRRVTADAADVRGVRPYRPGDPIRAVHWRSTARRGALMVREYDAAPSPDLVLVVEPWLPAGPDRADLDAVEAALSLAVTVVRTWAAASGTRATVAVAGDPDSVRTTAPTDAGVRDALVPLADVVGADRFEPLSPQAFDRSLTRAARVVVSSRPDTPYAGALYRSTGRPFLVVCPEDRLAWYQPPAGVVTGGSRTVDSG